MTASKQPDPYPSSASTSAIPPVYMPTPLQQWMHRYRMRGIALPILLLLASIVTTMAIGARFMANFLQNSPPVVSDTDLWPWPWLMHHPANFLLGWSFSLALLGILITHELGHYFACRVHRIRATLPWVLPAPTLSGTAGAVIQIRSRIPNRRALMDVGIYGPLAGYIASLIAITVGFCLSPPEPANHVKELIRFGDPLTLNLVHSILIRFRPEMPSFHAATPHPVLIAGWIGLFITALNLLPGGQLDGGHILYSIAPRAHRVVSSILPVALLLFGIFFWIGWFLWGALLLLPAMRHPRIPSEPRIGPKRRMLGVVALALLALTFSPEPFRDTSLYHYLYQAVVPITHHSHNK